jgi:hypothetical protein
MIDARMIVVLALAALVFLVCRVIVLWYWRVNEIVALLKSIDEKLGQRVAKAVEIVGGRDVVPAVATPQTSVPADADSQFEKWLATRDPPLVNLTPGERAYYRQSWESSHAQRK